jgi:maltose alpha-D-glucosyltransferase/alpha-amylase
MLHSPKKLFSLAISIFLLLQNAWKANLGLAASALPLTASTNSNASAETQAGVYTGAAVVPQLLAQNMRQSIAAVYGANRVDEIYNQLLSHIEKARQQRPIHLQQQDLTRPSDWYKDEVMYMIYADRYGVKAGNKTTTFHDLIGTLDYLKDLGVTTLYILPFMDSPMGDAGFDVRNFQSVRDDLGGLSEFQAFAQEAHKRGFKIKSDLILNHISDQHVWFQDALKGDADKIDYFVTSRTEPKYKKYNDPAKGIMVDYQEPDGKVSSRSLVFPDISSTHYREETIQGKKYWFYHTFYPFQMDINWENPKVMYEVLDIIAFWANQGVDIFRLDAAPYLIKTPGTNAENQPGTMAMIRLLSCYLQAIAPASVMQAEAGQKMEALLPYFGTEEKYTFRELNRQRAITRTDRVQIAYNFPYMSAMWASLITQDKSHFWSVAGEAPELPSTASWATFLRVHDELTLQMVDPETRAIVADNLEPKGAEFRKGWGVSGRMAEFLDKDPKRIELAFAMMFSLPGIPIIYYGDEIGELNDFEFAKEYAAQREATQRKNNPKLDIISFYDSRDVNRGPVPLQKLNDAMRQPASYGGEIYQSVKHLIKTRKGNAALTRGNLVQINCNQPAVFAYLREYGAHRVAIVNNLSNQVQKTTLNMPDEALAELPEQGSLRNLQSDSLVPFTRSGRTLQVELQPYQSLWVNLENVAHNTTVVPYTDHPHHPHHATHEADASPKVIRIH